MPRARVCTCGCCVGWRLCGAGACYFVRRAIVWCLLRWRRSLGGFFRDSVRGTVRHLRSVRLHDQLPINLHGRAVSWWHMLRAWQQQMITDHLRAVYSKLLMLLS